MVNGLRQEIRGFKELLVNIGKVYHQHVPVGEIIDRLPSAIKAVDEAGEPWEGILCGHEGVAMIDLVGAGRTFKTLVIRWYRMGSGRFEVTAYMA